MAQKDAKLHIALLGSSASIARAGKEDSAIMRKIAIETKKDNASMKTIAILGMFFLPGTFVAVSEIGPIHLAQLIFFPRRLIVQQTIFTMPVFDADLRVRNDGFGNYWAITIPLTFSVLFMWAMATMVRYKNFAVFAGNLRARNQSKGTALGTQN